jgi:hypothetical protein
MIRRPRLRRVIKWVGLLMCLLIAMVGLLKPSMWNTIAPVSPTEDFGIALLVILVLTTYLLAPRLAVHLWCRGHQWYHDRRSIPPGHCQKCGYDLTGNESGRCPECGTAIQQIASRPAPTSPAYSGNPSADSEPPDEQP